MSNLEQKKVRVKARVITVDFTGVPGSKFATALRDWNRAGFVNMTEARHWLIAEARAFVGSQQGAKELVGRNCTWTRQWLMSIDPRKEGLTDELVLDPDGTVMQQFFGVTHEACILECSMEGWVKFATRAWVYTHCPMHGPPL